MHNVLFTISALAGAAGLALLRWSTRREAPHPPEPAAERPSPPAERPFPSAADRPSPPAAERPPAAAEQPPAPAERSALPKPLRVTVVVEPLDQPDPSATTITLPEAYPAALGDDHRRTTSTTYLVEAVEVELNDFFDTFTTTSQRGSPDLHHCDVVVRGGGNHVGAHARHVITRAAMPLAVLMKDDPTLAKTCAQALVDPTRRGVFGERVAAREGVVLEWLERHELALTQPVAEQGEAPPEPPDQRRWPFVFEEQQVEDEARRS
ncbi:hypothetical protein ACFFQW_43085 [Umezawaea endophytica]|uniref:Uncharacterized protein n=1 Tax=Umezawaea endophytica TaxID=1654476 RepID=A0A9X3AG01_9PSEU|nr:hypothetical protein [Umezawaea endophytica]MCS7478966.1 hypothetical protein [Umezawaea endophytica]